MLILVIYIKCVRLTCENAVGVTMCCIRIALAEGEHDRSIAAGKRCAPSNVCKIAERR